MAEKTIPITRDGQAKLRRDIDELLALRVDLANRIHAAREHTVTQNNAEYEDAKAAMERNENRIRELQDRLQHTVLIDEERAHRSSWVQVGSTVFVSADGREREYRIVGPTEADPAGGLISNESPVGKALLGKRVGDDVNVMAPRGVMRMKVTRIA